MSNLKPTLPLGSYAKQWTSLSLQERYVGEIVSIATPQGREKDFSSGFKTTFGKPPPKPNCYVEAQNAQIIWSGVGQYLALIDGENVRADIDIARAFKGRAYTTLQSDGWASLVMSGDKCLDVLERFIALDLRPAKADFAARTVAHHIAVIVIKLSETEFQLLTPRSSAHSFVSALEHVVEHVVQPQS